MTFVEFEIFIFVNFPREISVLCVWRNERDKTDLSSDGKELGDLRDTSDVLGTGFWGKSEILVESLSDNISIENEYFFVVCDKSIDLFFKCRREC